ncbi:MAG TPA: transporter substrate-binding domain-containing protein [Alphaproteobacteria bacterium]
MFKNTSSPVWPVLLAVILSVGLSWCLFGRAEKGAGAEHVETAFERIQRTRTIRCGYYIYPPVTYKDGNTGKLSGLSVDMMDRIAKRADLKVEWVQEVNFGDWQEGLRTKRYDLACTPMWPNTAIGQVVYFTKPFFYSGIYPIGRGNDNRFNKLEDLNKPNVTVSVQEGNDGYYLAPDVFPQAKKITVAASTSGNMVIQDVVTKKADFVLLDKNAVNEFNSTNPDAIKVLVDHPVKMMPFTLAVGVGEDAFLQFINNATDEMILTGEIDRLVKKWVKDPSIYQPNAPVWMDY